MFLALGIIIIYLALTNNLITHASYQISINVYLTRFIQYVGTYTKIIPEQVWAIIFLLIFLVITLKSASDFLKSRTNQAEKKEGDRH